MRLFFEMLAAFIAGLFAWPWLFNMAYFTLSGRNAGAGPLFFAGIITSFVVAGLFVTARAPDEKEPSE